MTSSSGGGAGTRPEWTPESERQCGRPNSRWYSLVRCIDEREMDAYDRALVK